MVENMRARTWKVWGQDGHRQRESFAPSWDFETESGAKVSVYNADATGTHAYSIVRITASTAEQCETELLGQLSDGVFENSRTGKVEELRDSFDLAVAQPEVLQSLLASEKAHEVKRGWISANLRQISGMERGGEWVAHIVSESDGHFSEQSLADIEVIHIGGGERCRFGTGILKEDGRIYDCSNRAVWEFVK
jgi:hypothetical protein